MRVVFCSLVLFVAGVVTASADVQNGTFQPGGSGAFQTVNSVNNSTIPDWDVTSGSVDWIGTYWPAPGGFSIDLDGNSPGTISQTDTFTPGTWVLYFFLGGNPDGPPDPKSVQVTAGASSQIFLPAKGTTSPHSPDFQEYSLAFTSTGSTTISFASLDPPGVYGPILADVSAAQPTSVPEPSSIFLVGTLFCAALIARMRKRTASR